MTISVDRIQITTIKTPQSLLYKRGILLKDEIPLDVTDLNRLLLNSLPLGIALDELSLGIQTMFLSLEKKPLEQSVVISAEILIILPNIIVVDDSNDETDLHHRVILTPLFRHEGPLTSQFRNNHLRLLQLTYLMNHQFMLALLLADNLDLRLHNEEDADHRLEEDLYDQGSLKEAVINDAHQMKKCSCSIAMQSITITPR